MAIHTIAVSSVRDRPLHNKVLPGVQSPGLLARRPLVGLILFLFGCLAFGALFYNLRAQGPLLAWDQSIANTLPGIGLKSPPFVKVLMNAGFYIGDQVLVGIAVLLDIYFIIKRYWQEFFMVTLGLGGAFLLFLSLSNLIGRARPLTQIWIFEKIPGFPSGHAISVVAIYGLLAYLLVPKTTSAFGKTAVVVAALLIIGFVGFSRVFAGGHYLTDVLTGFTVGLAWSGALYTLIELYFQKRRSKNVKKE